MEIKVNVEVSLSKATTEFLAAALGAAKPKTAAPEAAQEVAEVPAAEEKPKRTRPSRAKEKPAVEAAPVEEKPAAEEADAFNELPVEEQLSTLQATVSDLTRNGRVNELRAILGALGVAKTRELTPGQYLDFNTALQRLIAGDPVDDITSDLIPF